MKKTAKNLRKEGSVKAENHLQHLISQKAKALSETTIANGRLISPEQLTELDQLIKLENFMLTYQSHSRSKRWRIVAACLLSLVLVSLLFFLRVSKTEIELEAHASELSFRLPSQQVLSNVIAIKSLGVSDAYDLELPPELMLSLRTDPSVSQVKNVYLSIANDSSCHGSLTLESFVLPKASQIRIRKLDFLDGIRLSLNADGASLRAALDGCITVKGTAPGTQKQVNYPIPKPILINLGANDADIDIELNENSKNLFAPFIQANAVDLFRVDQLINENHSIIRLVSTISAGKIYLEALADEVVNLRTAEPLRFTDSEGELRSITLVNNELVIQYHGDVSGMKTGSEKHPRSLMPSYLDWLKANHSLSLLWGSVVYLAGLVLSLLKWWDSDSTL